MLTITHTFAPYNSRRYGKPWIARVTSWPVGGKPELAFGHTEGLTAEIAAEVGDIVRWGQRDHRGNNTTAYWGIIDADGSFKESTVDACREAFRAREADLAARRTNQEG